MEALLHSTAFTDTETQRLGEVFARAELIDGCVFYDPRRNRILTEHSGDARRPLKHPVMCAVETLAKRQLQSDADGDEDQYLANGKRC